MSFGPVPPPPPPPIHNVSVRITVAVVAGFLFCFPLNLCWLLADHTTRLIRGNDSVFSSPQLKHYRQTHSFIIWGGKRFSTSTDRRQCFLRCRDAALLFSGTEGATNIRKILLLYLATAGNMIHFYSNKRKVGLSYRLYFSTLIVQCYLWASVCLWWGQWLYTVFLGFMWCFLLFCNYLGLYPLVIFAYFINIDVCALSPLCCFFALLEFGCMSLKNVNSVTNEQVSAHTELCSAIFFNL